MARAAHQALRVLLLACCAHLAMSLVHSGGGLNAATRPAQKHQSRRTASVRRTSAAWAGGVSMAAEPAYKVIFVRRVPLLSVSGASCSSQWT
jgi:hypothetical protein